MLIKVGSIISYKLRAIDLPTHPDKLWRGRITHVNELAHVLSVELLEPGFEDMKEPVSFEQIVRVEDDAVSHLSDNARRASPERLC